MSDEIKKNHEKWMKEAIKLARKALEVGEFPVGCVLVQDNKIVGIGSRVNSIGSKCNELDHAEILALRDFSKKTYNVKGVTAYTTLEPCLMCLGALVISGIEKIVYAYEDVMGGACSMNFSNETLLYKKMRNKIVPHVLRQESLYLFKEFFSNPQNSYLSGTLLERYTLNQA